MDGSKFKAVNTRDKNFTATKLKKRMEQVADHHREGPDATPLLEPLQLRDLCDEGPVHASQGTARHPLGT